MMINCASGLLHVIFVILVYVFEYVIKSGYVDGVFYLYILLTLLKKLISSHIIVIVS